MTDESPFDFETPLVIAVRHYLLQKPNERISEDKHLRPVCGRLAAFLNHLLKGEDGWGRYRSVDGIMPCTAAKVSSKDLDLTGLAIWMGDDGRKEWIDPLSASIHLSDDPPEVHDYQLFFGNAALGLGQRPYGSSQDFPYVPVTDWMFTFNSHAHPSGVE